jgi:hypothetical protein
LKLTQTNPRAIIENTSLPQKRFLQRAAHGRIHTAGDVFQRLGEKLFGFVTNHLLQFASVEINQLDNWLREF